MEYVLIPLVALFAASLTLFSGFGLGTVLMPAFALFFPLPVAVAATAIVHLANNVFKVALVGRKADRQAVLWFALPAAIAAIPGALLLNWLTWLPRLAAYQVAGRTYDITLVKLVIGLVIIAFAFFELLPRLQRMSFDRRLLPVGGIFSGFFGGLSGNQGALRSAFLVKTGLDKETYVGTGAVSAFIVDVVRVLVYGAVFYAASFAMVSGNAWTLVFLAVIFAFAGSFIGSRLVKKVTIRTVQYVVGVLLVVVGAALAAGLA